MSERVSTPTSVTSSQTLRDVTGQTYTNNDSTVSIMTKGWMCRKTYATIRDYKADKPDGILKTTCRSKNTFYNAKRCETSKISSPRINP